MLSDKQSMILTGLMTGGIFIFGVLGVLDNFIILTILTSIFFMIILNILYSKFRPKKKIEEQNDK